MEYTNTGFEVAIMAFYAIIVIATVVGLWNVFEKAGRKGWESIVPFWNVVVMLKIVGKPWWWMILIFIPYLGLIWNIWMHNLLAQKFGKGPGYTVGLILLPFIFWPNLGFGKAQYGDPMKKDAGVLNEILSSEEKDEPMDDIPTSNETIPPASNE